LTVDVASDENVAEAVYAHIQAIRALGKKTVNTGEIARALKLKPSQVAAAVGKLKIKGVKRAR
jgi:Mn-dependent DtxR family transcriptional regulator